MIELTKLNQQTFMLNDALIETIEETPDTVITTTTAKKFVVAETVSEVIDKMIAYQQRIIIPLKK
jgi:flagellar protein FlbD